MITNEYIQYGTYVILLFLVYRIFNNGLELNNLKNIKEDLVNQNLPK